ncbi:unnamed protein product [Rotaria sp. Silwood1]|nr:unnamed protein product [Rotaria sp. Silwood1]
MQSLSTTYQDYVPVLSSLEFFDLQTTTMCCIDSLSVILRCLPNLRQFIFTLIASEQISHYINDLLDGHHWQRILTNHVPHLKTFDFLIDLLGTQALLNIDYIVHSFQYFVVHYDGWHMTVERSRFCVEKPGDYVSLRTLTYSINRPECNLVESDIVLATLDVRSTLITDAQYQMFHNHNKKLKVMVPTRMIITGNVPSCPLFQNVQHLIIGFQEQKPIVWRNLWDLVSIPQDDIEITDPIKCVNMLKRYMDVSVVKELDIDSTHDGSQFMYIEEVLFRLQRLQVVTEDVEKLKPWREYMFFSLQYAPDLIQRFPSLIDIELPVFSFNTCIQLADILLDGLANLHHLKIHFINKTTLDNSYSRDDVIETCRQAFPFNIINEDRVIVKINKQSLEIYLE